MAIREVEIKYLLSFLQQQFYPDEVTIESLGMTLGKLANLPPEEAHYLVWQACLHSRHVVFQNMLGRWLHSNLK